MTTDELKKSNSSIASIDKFPDRDSAFAESGLNQDFREQFNANWDAYNPDSIQDTFWDRVSNFFGARSSADKSRLQLEQARKEQIAQLVGLQREQEYNSESAKAARMRAAGLNPDLQGLGDASEASEATEPEQRPDFSQLGTGKDIASGFAHALTTALSLFSGVQSLKMQGIEIAKGEIEQAVSGADNAISLISNLYSKEGFKEYFDDPEKYASIPKKAFQNLGIRSARGRKMLISYVNSLMNTYGGEIKKYKTLDEWLSSKQKFAEGSSKWYMSNGADTSDADMRSALKVYADLLHSLDVRYSTFQRTYYSLLKADKIAEAQNAAAGYHKFVTDKKQELYKKLVGSGDTFSLILATQLMGDVDFLGNSGVKDLAGAGLDYLIPSRSISKILK